MEKNSNWNSAITISFGDILGILGVAVPTAFVIRRFQTNWKHWKSSYYPNSVVIDLSIIVKNASSKKYRLITRTIYNTQLTHLIDNEHGIKKIQKAMQNCSFSDPFIKLNPIQNQWYLYNKAISEIEQNYRISWFERDIGLKLNQNGNMNSDPIPTEKYIFSMWCPYHWDGNLMHINVDNIHKNLLKEYLRFSFKKQDKTTNFKTSKRIRGNIINKECLETLIREIDMKNITDKQWQKMYDCGDMEKGSSMYHDRILRWHFIKKVAEKYYKNEREWANPLCTVQIPVPNGQHIPIHEIQSSNIYHPYTYSVELKQEKVYE